MKTKFTMHQWTGGTLLAGLSLVVLPAFAQEVENLQTGQAPPAPPQMEATKAPGRLPITATAGVSEQFYSKLEDKSAAFSVTRFTVGAAVPVQLNDNFRLDNSLRYGFDSYNWDFLTGPAPWHNINSLSLGSILQWKIDDTWSAYGGGFVRSSADSDVGFFKGVSGGGLAGFNYRVNDDLSLGAGLAVASQIKDHTLVLPLVTARWKFADDWRLDVGLSDVATTGYGGEVKWLFNEAWDFGAGVQYHNSRFRIANANQGVGQEKAALIYADATWHATSQVNVSGYAGVAVGGMVDVYNNAGSKISDTKYNPAPVIGVKGSVQF